MYPATGTTKRVTARYNILQCTQICRLIISVRGAGEGGFWRISLMRRSELTNVRVARDDQLQNEEDRVLPCFSR